MAKTKTFNSVSDLVRETSGDPGFFQGFARRLADRSIITGLMVLRAARGLSQADVAASLGCTQSRISKLESMNDADLKIGDLAKYADAMGLHLKIVLEPKQTTPVNRVKRLAFQMKRELDDLAGLGSEDHDIAKGVAAFLGEAFFNLVAILQSSAKKLPSRPEDGEPYISFETLGEEDQPREGAEIGSRLASVG